jgi:predicted aspartyl protease
VEGVIQDSACHVKIQLSLPGATAPNQTVSALIDTGATISCVHPDVQSQLSLPVVDRVTMHHADGNTVVPVVAASVVIQDGNNKAVRAGLRRFAVAKSTEEMIFGMDLMDGGILTVDQVRNTWEWKLSRIR